MLTRNELLLEELFLLAHWLRASQEWEKYLPGLTAERTAWKEEVIQLELLLFLPSGKGETLVWYMLPMEVKLRLLGEPEPWAARIKTAAPTLDLSFDRDSV